MWSQQKQSVDRDEGENESFYLQEEEKSNPQFIKDREEHKVGVVPSPAGQHDTSISGSVFTRSQSSTGRNGIGAMTEPFGRT